MRCNTKIPCKALSNTLEQFVPKLVSNDQIGFVMKSQGFHNIRRVLNVHERHTTKDMAMLSIDACQAFDRIAWDYLFNALPRWGFGDTFKWIQLLYTNYCRNLNISAAYTLQ